MCQVALELDLMYFYGPLTHYDIASVRSAKIGLI